LVSELSRQGRLEREAVAADLADGGPGASRVAVVDATGHEIVRFARALPVLHPRDLRQRLDAVVCRQENERTGAARRLVEPPEEGFERSVEADDAVGDLLRVRAEPVPVVVGRRETDEEEIGRSRVRPEAETRDDAPRKLENQDVSPRRGNGVLRR